MEVDGSFSGVSLSEWEIFIAANIGFQSTALLEFPAHSKSFVIKMRKN
jgi:hypothetical protein